ncbi:hypothetical protein D3C81_1548890 [compost metagenome]
MIIRRSGLPELSPPFVPSEVALVVLPEGSTALGSDVPPPPPHPDNTNAKLRMAVSTADVFILKIMNNLLNKHFVIGVALQVERITSFRSCSHWST